MRLMHIIHQVIHIIVGKNRIILHFYVNLWLLPVFFAHAPQLQCQPDVLLADDLAFVEIRRRARDLENAVVGACGKRELVVGGLHQLSLIHI